MHALETIGLHELVCGQEFTFHNSREFKMENKQSEKEDSLNQQRQVHVCVSHRFYDQVLNDVNGGELLIRRYVAACSNHNVVAVVEAVSLFSGSGAHTVGLIIGISVHRL